jgi:hypothetical protein
MESMGKLEDNVITAQQAHPRGWSTQKEAQNPQQLNTLLRLQAHMQLFETCFLTANLRLLLHSTKRSNIEIREIKIWSASSSYP